MVYPYQKQEKQKEKLRREMVVILSEESSRRSLPCAPEQIKLITESYLNRPG